jgi:hypothetical protein
MQLEQNASETSRSIFMHMNFCSLMTRDRKTFLDVHFIRGLSLAEEARSASVGGGGFPGGDKLPEVIQCFPLLKLGRAKTDACNLHLLKEILENL